MVIPFGGATPEAIEPLGWRIRLLICKAINNHMVMLCNTSKNMILLLSSMSHKIIALLSETFPKILMPVLREQFAEAVHTDMVLYRDEPHAMIALICYEANWAGFAEVMADMSLQEMFSMMEEAFSEKWA